MSSYEIGADEMSGDDLIGDELGDELGADDFGDDFGDELGADLFGAADPAKKAVAVAKKQQVQMKKMAKVIKKQGAMLKRVAAGGGGIRLPSGNRLIERAPTEEREEPLNFRFAAIVAGATQRITSAPQVKFFRGERLVIPQVIAPFFIIEDVLVGNKSAFTASGGMAAEVVANNSVGVRLNLDVCELGKVIVIVATNIDTNPRDFYATIIGRSIN